MILTSYYLLVNTCEIPIPRTNFPLTVDDVNFYPIFCPYLKAPGIPSLTHISGISGRDIDGLQPGDQNVKGSVSCRG
ncbi:MAG: hypothetical protein METHAR1v1_970024 [Methanothrix sp.]|nr:MAG: hypothetical protein METHAR1v1_970024 [Methanothrix sp.]